MFPIRDFSDAYAFETKKSPDVRQEIAETETLSAIVKTCDLARKLGSLALVVGAAGTGKTTAFEYVRNTSPNSYLVTLSRTARTLSVGLELILDAIGISGVYHAPHLKVRLLVSEMKARAEFSASDVSEKPLIVIDEAQHADNSLLEEIRSINDRSGVGMVLSGNPTVLRRWYHRGTPKPEFAHLTGRIISRLQLDEPTAADVERIARQHGIDDAQSLEFLQNEACRGEGLRPAVHLISLARDFLADGQQIGLSHLKAARNLKNVSL